MGDYDDWCRWLFDSLRDGGEWIVPRSGLILRKNEADSEFVLIGTGTSWIALADFDTIRDHFRAAGIGVRQVLKGELDDGR